MLVKLLYATCRLDRGKERRAGSQSCPTFFVPRMWSLSGPLVRAVALVAVQHRTQTVLVHAHVDQSVVNDLHRLIGAAAVAAAGDVGAVEGGGLLGDGGPVVGDASAVRHGRSPAPDGRR